VIAELSTRFTGQLVQPTDAAYDAARRVHNGLVDKRPLLIARCAGVADIVDAVNLGRDNRLEVAIRGGGHNVAGRATIDGGLMIDVSLMKGIHVNPKARTARAQGGVTWRELNRETQAHGLAVTGGIVSSTGIAGLTLGGGFGWLMGTHALAADNLISVDMVTADGRVRTASDPEDPDLFWAVRGAGANFGVAASFEYRLHPVGPRVTGGLVAHPFEKARDVLRFYRDVTTSPPDELTAFAGLLHAPDGSAKLAGIVACHSGSLADGEKAVRGLKQFGPPIMDALAPVSYQDMNAMLDAGYPRGALNYWKSNFLATLSDEAIDTMIACYERCPSPMSQLLLENFHGAATRVAPTATAFPHRTAGYNFLVLGQWTEPADSDRCIAWARESFQAMQPFMAAGRYVNYLDDDEGDPGAAAYGPNFERIRQLKTKYDPDNFFHMNQNVRPAR
jgi:FAD/FMN-containing dehydrogenase